MTFLLLVLAALSAPPMTFRDLTLGQKCSEIKGTSVVDSEGDDVVYQRSTDTMSLGGVTLTSIYYICWKDQLSSVMVGFHKYETDSVLSMLTDVWGEPYRSNPYIDKWVWFGGKTTGYLNGYNGVFMISSTEVEEKKKASKSVLRKGDL